MNLRIFVSALLVFLHFANNIPLFAQRANHEPGVVLVNTKPGVLRTQVHRMGVDNITIDSLRNVLTRLGVRSIEKIFPNFQPSDTAAYDLNGKPVRLIDVSGWLKLEFDRSAVLPAIIAVLSTTPGIEKAHLDYLVERTDTFPSEINTTEKQRLQWGLYNPDARAQGLVRDINAPAAWDIQRGRNDVVVAVIDDGVDHSHLDLDPGDRSRVIFGWNFINGDNNTMPDPSATHGTRVAGVIGAITNNGLVYGQNSVAGVMWNGKLMPLKAAPQISQKASAVDWARANGAHIVNMSFALPRPDLFDPGYEDFDVFNAAIANAYKQGLALPSSMGNNNKSTTYFPAGFFGAIAVGGTDKSDVRWTGSNYGSHISIVAPAEDYRTTNPGGTYTQFGGTSLSTPLVAGAIGLILSQSRDRGLNISNDDVKHLLEATADKVDGMQGENWTQFYGYGRINLGRAIQVLNTPYTVTRTTLTGGSITMTRDFHQRALYASYYLGGLASGTYVCKQYKVTWHVNFPTMYSQVPYVWVRERESNGWYGDGTTNGIVQDPWAKVTNVTTTGFDVETYVYWIESNILGQQIRKYWPGNTDNIQAAVAYTVIGIPQPPSVTISGPTELQWKQQGTWTANATGGTGTYSYEWRWRDYPSGSWSGVVSTTNQYSRQMPNNDIELQVKVTSGGVDVYDTHIVWLSGGAKVVGPVSDQSLLIPEVFALSQNYPNPFNPETEISFALPEPSSVRLSVLDVLGREVAVLEDRFLPAGYRTARWNGRNTEGEPVGSGLYFYRINAVGESGRTFFQTMKMVMAK
ncbi:MAG TPA: S8 family serine peptidase [Bacteroidota bacterium]|nr:S8 family serine peptidase [Bacteroidota bacterium]